MTRPLPPEVIEQRALDRLMASAQFYKLPPPLDKTWINGIRAESKDAIQMFQARCPDIWKSS